MDRLDGHVKRELRRFGPADIGMGGDMVAYVRAWPAAVGEENARRAWPSRLARDGTLIVHTTDSVWAFQLGMLSGEILGRLRDEVGEEAPRTIRFVPGPVPAEAAAPAEERVPTPPEVGPEDAAEGVLLAAGIEDAELREIVARAAAASLARGRREAHSDRDF